jgi:hypothetical protein
VSTLRKWWRRLFPHRWIVVRTRWPYLSGWGTYCTRTKTLLESGLTKEAAEKSAALLNQTEGTYR